MNTPTFLKTSSATVSGFAPGTIEAVLNAAIAGSFGFKTFSISVHATEANTMLNDEAWEARAFLTPEMMPIAREALTKAGYVVSPVKDKTLGEEFIFTFEA